MPTQQPTAAPAGYSKGPACPFCHQHVDQTQTAQEETWTVWHVSFVEHLSSILREGLVITKRRIWRSVFGTPIGERGCVYAFTDRRDAVLWAAKMQWELRPRRALVVEVQAERTEWEEDALTRILQYGTSIKHRGPIPGTAIIRAFTITPTDVREVTHVGPVKVAPTTPEGDAPAAFTFNITHSNADDDERAAISSRGTIRRGLMPDA